MKKKFCIFLALILLFSSLGTATYANDAITDGFSLTRFDIPTQTKTIIHVPAITDHSDTGTSPASSLMSSRSIIGTDNRVRVTNPLVFPYYATVYIKTTFSNNTVKNGTGFMISENVLLTAGHCVTSDNPNATVTNMMVYAGRTGSSYTASSTVDTFYTDTKYAGPAANEYDWDYAVVVLDTAIGNTTGWLGLHYTIPSDLASGTISTTGYPLTPLNNDPYPTMYVSSGSVSTVSTYQFTHTADTTGGQSGSPVYKYISGYGYAAVGIHVASGNIARRITETLYNWLYDEGYVS